MKYRIKQVAFSVALIGASSSLYAGDFFTGLSFLQTDMSGINWSNNVRTPFGSDGSFIDDSSDTVSGYRLFGGYQFHDRVAIQVDATRYGKTYQAASYAAVRDVGQQRNYVTEYFLGDVATQARGLSIVATLPVTEHFGFTGRAGINRVNNEVNFDIHSEESQVINGELVIDSLDNNKRYDTSETVLIYAFGFYANWNDVQFSIERESNRADDLMDIKAISVNTRFFF